ncbi:MAG TPA: M14 family zinc carboxypeptidase [Candidatus Limnocylindrales bacterium]|nr:M14 family zinc carboxypeptidase [Candidatus Limnocylindrales bacterium]
MNRLAVALALAAMLLGALGAAAPVSAVSEAGYPDGFEGYHDYAELEAAIDAAVAARPSIVSKRTIGTSYEGRSIWAVKISDNVGSDEDEPEVLMDSLHHAREHLTVEMALHIIAVLSENYRSNPANIENPLEQRVTDIVKGREVWIVPMVNPDGAEWDISDSTAFQNWRRNRQLIEGSAVPGVDLNRNWGFKWGCCGGSSGQPGTTTYRGPAPWSTPEIAALRDFVLSRVINGRQQIRAAISWHTFNEEIMWPYGYTTADLPRTMSPDDLLAFQALGHGMADRNGYVAQQMSDLYILDGAASDWLYGDQRIFAFTIEMYPTDGSNVGGFYPPDDIIDAQTARNDEAVLFFLEQSDCPYRAADLGVTHCGPLNDDFETGRGWQINAAGTDTATSGLWERGTAQKTTNAAGIKQRAYGFSGLASLVTGALTGSSVTGNDVDGGVTSALSPTLPLGSPGSTGWTLSFRYTFAHNAQAKTGDQLRIKVNGTVVFVQLANGTHRNADWTTATVSLDAYAGQTIRLLAEAVDAGADHLVEAAIDDLRVYRAPL